MCNLVLLLITILLCTLHLRVNSFPGDPPLGLFLVSLPANAILDICERRTFRRSLRLIHRLCSTPIASPPIGYLQRRSFCNFSSRRYVHTSTNISHRRRRTTLNKLESLSPPNEFVLLFAHHFLFGLVLRPSSIYACLSHHLRLFFCHLGLHSILVSSERSLGPFFWGLLLRIASFRFASIFLFSPPHVLLNLSLDICCPFDSAFLLSICYICSTISYCSCSSAECPFGPFSGYFFLVTAAVSSRCSLLPSCSYACESRGVSTVSTHSFLLIPKQSWMTNLIGTLLPASYSDSRATAHLMAN
eukprot:jgi/Psemu1/68509/estExt_Genemark1.C_5170001